MSREGIDPFATRCRQTSRLRFSKSVTEIRRLLNAGRFRRRLAALTAGELARKAGFDSVQVLWNSRLELGLGLNQSSRQEVAQLLRDEYPGAVARLKEACERILRHEFDLLGSGPTQLGDEIDWHLDFKSGRRWDRDSLSHRIHYAELDRPSDVKVPWELSRCQHLVTLGRGWTVFRDVRYASEFQNQIRSWIRANPIGFGVNWACTMDVALRAVNWVWALTLLEDAPLEDGFLEEILLRLYQHGLWIPQHLEIGAVNGNHFLFDVLGMIACGTLFSADNRGQLWLQEGVALLEREMLQQVENDGVTIEASLQYHRLVLEIFLVGRQFCMMAARPLSSAFEQRLQGMFEYVYAYTTPQGGSPIVGDADDGRALILGDTEMTDHRYLLSTGSVLFRRGDWKERAGDCWEDSLWLLGPEAKEEFDSIEAVSETKSHHFADSGVHILRSRHQYLFVDAGPVGFKGAGGHGHNDCLSFEWHALGRALLTDSGAFVYTAAPDWRNQFRSTEFHNTIRVDSQEINRFPSALALWTLTDDAQPTNVEWHSSQESEKLAAGHTGYNRLADPVSVSRHFELDRRKPVLLLHDDIGGQGEHYVEFFFHAAPGATTEKRVGGVVLSWDADLGVELQIQVDSLVDWVWETRLGWFSPSYGIKTERPVWVAHARVKLPISVTWRLDVQLQGGSGEKAHVERKIGRLV